MKRLCALILVVLVPSSQAAQYFVRTDGNDSNAGTTNSAGGAWLTIQRAANTMGPGDTVTVAAGNYPEYVATVNNGTNGNPITYQASGAVYTYGFNVNDNWQVLRGFTIRHHSRANIAEAAVYLNQNASNSVVEYCTFGPGMFIKKTDLTFADTNPDTVTAASGGFIAAGFRAGATLRVSDSETNTDTENDGSAFLIASVTDTTITLDAGASVTAETGRKAFLFGGARGINFYSTVANCTVRYNLFSDHACEAMTMNGSGHLVERNIITNPNGFDGILYTGTNNTIRHNLIHNGLTFQYYDPSPDLLSNMSPGTINNVLIEENMVIDQIGALGFDHGVPGSGLTIRRNVFVNCGHGYALATGNVVFENNTFYLVGITNTTVAQRQDFPIEFWDTASNHTSATVSGNLIIASGYGADPTRGWYRTLEPALTITANHNMVAGASPTFGTKTGFSEVNGINGGNPMFVNVNDPIGPDGIIFTADDGFRLLAGSPAIGTGPSGADLGAYDYDSGGGAPASSFNATTTTTTTVTVGP